MAYPGFIQIRCERLEARAPMLSQTTSKPWRCQRMTPSRLRGIELWLSRVYGKAIQPTRDDTPRLRADGRTPRDEPRRKACLASVASHSTSRVGAPPETWGKAWVVCPETAESRRFRHDHQPARLGQQEDRSPLGRRRRLGLLLQTSALSRLAGLRSVDHVWMAPLRGCDGRFSSRDPKQRPEVAPGQRDCGACR